MSLITKRTFYIIVIILSTLVLSLIFSLFFGGIGLLLNYKKSVDESFPVNVDTVHLFTTEFIERRVQEYRSGELPENTSIPEFKLYTSEDAIRDLNMDLPDSGKLNFKTGYLSEKHSGFESKVDFRYKGGLSFHWLNEKKSLRLKMKSDKLFNNQRVFDIVNPPTIHHVIDLVSFDVSKQQGLLVPDYKPVRLYLNDKYNGLHFYLDYIDESFLRKRNRMPGSIYYGDTLNLYLPFPSKVKSSFEKVFSEENGESTLWHDERLWEKKASKNSELKSFRDDIRKFIDIANEDDTLKFANQFVDYLDTQKFYTFWMIDSLFGGFHHDNFHNHRIYFDPYKGRFEPIQWDFRYWSIDPKNKDTALTELLKRVKLNPVLDFEKDKVLFKLLNQYSVELIFKMIDDYVEIIEPELVADPYRQYQDEKYVRFIFGSKQMPFSIDEFKRAIANLKSLYETRYGILRNMLESTQVSYSFEKKNEKELLLRVLVDGNSPASFHMNKTFPEFDDPLIKVSRVVHGNKQQVDVNAEHLLFPGRKLVFESPNERYDDWSVAAFGLQSVKNTATLYQFVIESSQTLGQVNKDVRVVENAVTGSLVTMPFIKTLENYSNETLVNNAVENTISEKENNSWAFLKAFEKAERTVVLKGSIEANQDLVFKRHEKVIIEPGTEFLLAEGVSIVVLGDLVINGEQNAPVIFKRKNKNRPWGAFIVQGGGDKASQVRHLEVSGGSSAAYNLVYYPGMINFHDLANLEISYCHISNNLVGDDAFHIAYSTGSLRHCSFENTAFDAIDIDISKMTLDNLTFKNIGNDAVDLMSSEVNINNVSVNGTGDKCFSIGERSSVFLSNSFLEKCAIGIAVKDESHAKLHQLTFKDVKGKSISLYRKNFLYNSGGVVKGEALHNLSTSDIEVDRYSKNLLRFESKDVGNTEVSNEDSN